MSATATFKSTFPWFSIMDQMHACMLDQDNNDDEEDGNNASDDDKQKRCV